jgi:flavodoxin
MNICIVYDSVFGNTEQIASALRDEMGDDAVLVKASQASVNDLEHVEVLIVGSPTRAFTATKPVKQFLKAIPNGFLKGVKVAAFDTRIDTAEVHNRILTLLVGIFGYAAEPIAKQLVRKGGTLVANPEGFMVKDSEGPLKDGEAARAAAWARSIQEKENN